MERFLKYLEAHDLKRLDCNAEGTITLDDSSSNFMHIVIDDMQSVINVATRACAAELVVVNSGVRSDIQINIESGAQLKLVELLYNCAEDIVTIDQSENSTLKMTILELATSSSNATVNLNGRGVDAQVEILQLPSRDEHTFSSLRIAHNSSDCTSRSISKCAAAGESTGEFHGLVYVAKDAQRTYAEQNSRNVALSGSAKIIAEPQLEIYADDVKCSHGATVGQMNKEAILYMRQRGLSEEQAQKMQLDGFVSEITNNCAIESIREEISEMVYEHLHSM